MLVLFATLLTPGAHAADFCVPQGYAPSGVSCSGSGDFPTMLELAAGTASGPHTIHLEPGLQVSDVVVVNAGELRIQTEAGADRATFTGAGGAAGVFDISGAATDVMFRNVDFEVAPGNKVLDVDSGATLRLEDVAVSESSVGTTTHSAIEMQNATLEAMRLSMVGFDSNRRGAHLELLDSSATVTDSTFSEGRTTASQGGGSTYIGASSATFIGTTFTHNVAEGGAGGGAVYTLLGAAGPIVFESCTFLNNQAVDASRGGGAIYHHEGLLEIVAGANGSTMFVDNSTSGDGTGGRGGALYFHQATAELAATHTLLASNSATGIGGAVFLRVGTASLTGVEFRGNSADVGGAVSTGGQLEIIEGAVCGNAASLGGGLYTTGAGTLSMTGSSIGRNDADGGSAILHRGNSVSLDQVTFLDNRFGTDTTRVFDTNNGSAGVTVTNTAFLFHDGQVLGDDLRTGTWSHNAWLDNTTDYAGDGSFQSNAVLTGDPLVNPSPPCSLDAFMPAAATSVLVGNASDGGTIGAVQFSGMDSDGDGWAGTSDCDDTDPSVFPGAPIDSIVMADGIDQDCDGFEECFLDEDGDGFGGTMLPVELGTPCVDEGALDQGGDCDDDDENVYPGAPLDAEAVLDMVDTDCDELEECFEDLDNDAFGSAVVIPGNGDGVCNASDGESPNDDDCNDLSPVLSPAVDEVCDGLDNDCDGLIDDDDDMLAAQLYTTDADGDGFGNVLEAGVAYCSPPSDVGPRSDCDDGDPTTYPGAIEACPDGIDNDCDGDVDADDADYSPDPLETWRDEDGDGYGTPLQVLQSCSDNVLPGYVPPGIEDCNDTDPFISPDANELCDGVDEDCNGVVDDGLPNFPVYDDLDGDGFGDPASEQLVCELDGTGVENGDDCDDTDPAVNPMAVETCDGADEDCDGLVDEGLDPVTTYEDVDGDGFGDGATAETTCEPDGDRVEVAGDCDDTDPDVNPDAEEVCDGLDNDCDGEGDPVCRRPTTTGCGCRSGAVPVQLLPFFIVLGMCRTRRRSGL